MPTPASSHGTGGGSSGAVTQISTTTLSADGTFDITSIPGVYNDLILVLLARDTSAGSSNSPVVRLNNDSTGTYFTQRIRGVGSTVSATEILLNTSFQQPALPGAAALANAFGVQVWTIFGYAATTWLKSLLIDETLPVGTSTGNLTASRYAAFWNSTAAVNRVTITGTSGANLVSGSQLRIYGRA